MKMDTARICDFVEGYYFPYSPDLAIIFNSVNVGIFLSYLIYWHGEGSRSDGWIYKTIEDARIETGLTRCQQDSAIKKLISLGLLEEERKGARGRRHFLLDIDIAKNVIRGLSENYKLKPRKNVGYNKRDCRKETITSNQSVENKQTLTYNTKHNNTFNIPRPFSKTPP